MQELKRQAEETKLRVSEGTFITGLLVNVTNNNNHGWLLVKSIASQLTWIGENAQC